VSVARIGAIGSGVLQDSKFILANGLGALYARLDRPAQLMAEPGSLL
jgi:hypothetical protein